jgi:succinoglycan biosynthesis protein ExoM
MQKVDICTITYQRPEGLARLLSGINKLTFNKVQQPDIEIVVVDNDPEESARKVFHTLAKKFRWKVHYFSEPRRGIPYARNTAIKNTRPDAEFILCIDDDEVPEPPWLDELLYIQEVYNADVVTGRVMPHFVDPPPPWIVHGRFYERRRHADGHVIDYASTANVFISMKAIRGMLNTSGTYFDERLALTGGSDTVFLRQAVRCGYKIVWADNAVVYEWLPPSKVNARWILQRALRTAQTDTYFDLLSQSPILARAKRVLLGCGRIIAGSTLIVPYALLGLFRGRHMTIRPVRIICRGVGMIMGALGIWYHEYKRIHSV